MTKPISELMPLAKGYTWTLFERRIANVMARQRVFWDKHPETAQPVTLIPPTLEECAIVVQIIQAAQKDGAHEALTRLNDYIDSTKKPTHEGLLKLADELRGEEK